MNIPPFAPRITALQGELHYTDDRVYGVMTSDREGHLCIQEWSSNFHGFGFTTDALSWLRQQGYEHIAVNGIGELEEGVDPDDSAAYWLHQFNNGLVDELFDDKGLNVTPKRSEPVFEDDDLDEFTFAMLLRDTGRAVNSIAKALEQSGKETRAIRAERKLSVHAVMSAFIKGQLKPQAELLEDSDALFEMMGRDPVRHTTILKHIYAMAGAQSLELAAVLLKRHPTLRLVKSEGSESERAFVMSPQGAVMTANGVLSAGRAMGPVGFEIVEADGHKVLGIAISKEREAELLDSFSWATQMMAEINSLSVNLSASLEP